MTDKTYIVKITNQAEEQLQAIVKYIASELKSPQAALNLLNEIELSISSLSQFPQRVELTKEEPKGKTNGFVLGQRFTYNLFR